MLSLRAVLLAGLLTSFLTSSTAQDVVFTHGVASGDVSEGSAVLWTRVDRLAFLLLEVSTDRSFATDVKRRLVLASASNDFTAKFIVGGLQAATDYLYRWRPLRGSGQSPVGSFRTAPEGNVQASARFAWTGDSDGTPGPQGARVFDFSVLEPMADDDLDFWIFLGDTVYQDSFLRPRPAATLQEYRQTYKVNRELRPMLEAFRATSSYVTWDDHEIINDYDGETVELGRYETGREAFTEYMPFSRLRRISDPSCAGDPLFGVFPWGSDIDLILIDARTCRSADAESSCLLAPGIPDLAPTLPPRIRPQFGLPPEPPAGCLEVIGDPSRTLLGAQQKEALKQALLQSTARYKFVINQLPIQQFFALPYDRWEGYAAERLEILNFIRDNRLENVFFLTADMHANLYNEVFVDVFTDNQVIANEFVTGPIGANTFQTSVLQRVGPAGLAGLNSALDLAGANCRQLDAFSYGLVEVGPEGLTISYKGEDGQVLADQQSSQPCRFQFD